VKMPSRLRTPSPPSLPSSIATCGETTPSIAEGSSGSSSRCGPSFQPMSTSCGSRVRLDGTIAMSSNPYACRAFFPRPISISTGTTSPGCTKAQAPLRSPGPKNRSDRLLSSGRRSYQRPQTASFAPDRLELGDLDRADQPARLARLEPARADLQRRRRAGGDRRAQGFLVRAPVEPRRDERGQQHVARADRRDRIDPRRGRPVARGLALVSQQRPAARLARDQDVARAHLGDRLEAGEEVVVVVELLADERLGLALV